MQNWKTTTAGALSAFTVTVGPLSGFLASLQTIQAQTPGHAPANYTLVLIGAALTTAGAIARLWIGLIMNDAPSTLAEKDAADLRAAAQRADTAK